MSNKYKDGDKVPASVICDRLYVLSCALTTQGRDAFEREFTMRIPAELDRDPDLVMSRAANIIEEQQEEIAQLREQLSKAWEIIKCVDNGNFNQGFLMRCARKWLNKQGDV